MSELFKISEMIEKTVDIGGRKYICIKGYPKFGIWKDEVKGKRSIANMDTLKATDAIFDEVIMSSLPLETWTANYVVVRIGEKYYLADNNGTCSFESDKPYIICRNVFAHADGVHYVVSNFTLDHRNYKTDNSLVKTVIKNVGGHSFLFLKDGKVFRFVKPNGEILDGCVENSAHIENLHNWLLSVKRWSEGGWRDRTYILDKDFNLLQELHFSPSIYAQKSRVFKLPRNQYYSALFMDYVDVDIYDDLEVVKYQGRLYFFRSDGKVEKTGRIAIWPKVVGSYIVYQDEFSIVVRDFEGKVVQKQKLSPKEVLEIQLLAKLAINYNSSSLFGEVRSTSVPSHVEAMCDFVHSYDDGDGNDGGQDSCDCGDDCDCGGDCDCDD